MGAPPFHNTARALCRRTWKRPWPNLEAVSMNLSLISSSALRLVCASRLRRSVTGRFLVPGTWPGERQRERRGGMRVSVGSKLI